MSTVSCSSIQYTRWCSAHRMRIVRTQQGLLKSFKVLKSLLKLPRTVNHSFSLIFYQFMEEFDFKHITSDPYYPQSNRFPEKAIWSVIANFNISLINYRTGPLSNGQSPSQTIFCRTIRTRLRTTYVVLNSANVTFSHSSQQHRQMFY